MPVGPRFLKAISDIESSGGKNTDHSEMESGIHTGESAVGEFGLMPNTSDEMINRMELDGRSSPELSALKGLSGNELKQAYGSHPELYKQVVDKLVEHVSRDTNDPRVAAYRWNMGHNTPLKSITDKLLQSSPYVQKFQQIYSTKDEQPNPMPTLKTFLESLKR